MIFIMLLDSIETKSDKDYWKNFNLPYPMNLETNDLVVVVAVDSRFELSMDNHYSSILMMILGRHHHHHHHQVPIVKTLTIS